MITDPLKDVKTALEAVANRTDLTVAQRQALLQNAIEFAAAAAKNTDAYPAKVEPFEAYWWCEKCQRAKSPVQVKFNETCTLCGTEVIAIDTPALEKEYDASPI